MTGRTHALLGVASLLLLQTVPGLIAPHLFGPLVAVAGLGALLPDLDAAHSQIKHLRLGGAKPFFLLSEALHQAFGHRGLLHSLVGLGAVLTISIVLALLAPWWNASSALTLSVGYASHLAGDACTKSGIPIFYPQRRRYHLLPRRLRLTTGSTAEDALFAVLAVFVLGWLLRLLWAGSLWPTAPLTYPPSSAYLYP